MSGPAQLDLGRIHYENWMVVGAPSRDVADGYRSGVRADLKPGGAAWFIGAGGPMGRMHVQRAIELEGGPRTILATDISTPRLDHLSRSFGPRAAAGGRALHSVNPADMPSGTMEEKIGAITGGKGFDDIVQLVPATSLIAQSFPYLAPGGTLNVFAGIARGVHVPIDLYSIYGPKQARIMGTSGSAIEDME